MEVITLVPFEGLQRASEIKSVEQRLICEMMKKKSRLLLSLIDFQQT
jgi:hypothetical protein